MRILSLLIMLFLSETIAAQLSKDSLLKIINAERRDDTEAKAYTLLATELLRSNIEQAKNYMHKAIPLAKEGGRTGALSGYYSILTTAHTNTGNADSASYYLSLLKHMALENKDVYKIQYNYHAASGLYHKKHGNYKAALPFMIKAATLAKQENISETTAGQYVNIGNTFTLIGDYKNALIYHLDALKLFESISNQRGISFCYQNISNAFLELGHVEKAFAYAQKSLTLKVSLKDERGIGNAYATLARIYAAQQKQHQAKSFFAKALERAEKLDIKTEQAKLKVELGKLHEKWNEKGIAKAYYTDSKQIALMAGDTTTAILADNRLLKMQSHLLQEKQNEEKLLADLTSNIRRGDKNDEAETYRNLSEHYERSAQPEKALAYLKQYYAKKDSLANAQLQLEIAQLEEQYKAERQESEIALLKKDQLLSRVKFRQQQSVQYALMAVLVLFVIIGLLLFNRYRLKGRNKRMLEIEAIRNRIAKDLHDDIGSTLTSIHITTKLLLQKNENAAAGEGLLRIKENTSAIMDNMSDIVWAINPQNDTVEKMIFRMKEFAAEVLDPLDIRYTFVENGNLSELKLDPQKKRDLYLIFKESINNAAKYSGCTDVTIMLEKTADSLQLQITDNGKGFDMALAKRGNGIGNIEDRTVHLRGSVKYFTQPGTGTSVELKMPIT